jgi:predicted RNA-binding protein with PIN domain
MTILIDGNNLIHKIPNIKALFDKDKVASQHSLIETVISRLNLIDKAIFVFDGHGNFRKENVIFSEKETADNVIRKKIEGWKDSKNLKVVSSDHEIIGLAKVCGCIVQKSEEFWKSINKMDSPAAGKNINQNFNIYLKEKPDRMSKKEIEEYKKLFT